MKSGSKTMVPFSPLFSIMTSNSAAPAAPATMTAAPSAIAAMIRFILLSFLVARLQSPLHR
jgi:hypothetical protein